MDKDGKIRGQVPVWIDLKTDDMWYNFKLREHVTHPRGWQPQTDEEAKEYLPMNPIAPTIYHDLYRCYRGMGLSVYDAWVKTMRKIAEPAIGEVK